MIDETKIARALAGNLGTTELTAEEFAAWEERFTELMGQPSPEELAFFEERRRSGLGVGLDADGKLVHGTSRT
ncbi:hypothetical protein [Histidinibacterium aquaticum]|uniref:Uncharacterized protein n=1 Tax=Histidinibacterium aquaticum TaxID=2613962 RepID=A0A5J5GI02_9RHOB|nr:hypothetical protein [Histidinibacterium aquaticum]KAA9007785.1 hypothetical protein F3S47_09655 [Histidinibacterium aquaticum]